MLTFGYACVLQDITLSDCCTGNLSNTAVEQMIMNHSTKTCKTFTTVNAFKYQLQHYLFHDAKNATQNLTSILTSLQATARYLQEIAITEVNYY